MRSVTTGLFFLVAVGTATVAHGEQLTYYIGRDAHSHLNHYHHANNDYVGLENPNYNRLTFLYAHWIEPPLPVQANHNHGRSNYFYSGPADSPTPVSDHPDNVIPELYTGFPALMLRPADSGPFAGKLTSYVYEDTSEATGEEGHYSDLRMASVHELDGFSPTEAEYWMRYGNRGRVGGEEGESDTIGRYSGVLDGSLIALNLVDITPGLYVGTADDVNVFDTGPMHILGSGESLRFEPTFWAEPEADAGDYTASFVLTDLNSATTGILDSGVFRFDFRVVPEPSGLMLGLVVALGAVVAGRRRLGA